ncbi:MAG: UDP-N-acetylmuramate dehydrogenase [Planctomycetes bacterium]|nr:UDP-N-acetylmuramate dehydrogenase [Planctomycetota bacterium]
MLFLKDYPDIVTRDEPLAPHTYFGLGGPAELVVRPRTMEELVAVVRRCKEEQQPLRVLGGGCNLLVRDEGVRGVVVHLEGPEFCGIRVQGSRVQAGAAALLSNAISQSVREGLAGLETLVGIPGSIGGALCMNAGGRAGDIGQFVCRATVMDAEGRVSERSRDEMSFAYRESSLDEPLILGGEFELEPGDPQEIVQRLRKLWIIKKTQQPLSSQSAGCIFKNPRELSAGMLLDQAGLKGTRVGGAEVSDRHANFIIAHEGATAQDVLRLIDLVRGKVAERFGIELELEIHIW